jgi:hypothetical protein
LLRSDASVTALLSLFAIAINTFTHMRQQGRSANTDCYSPCVFAGLALRLRHIVATPCILALVASLFALPAGEKGVTLAGQPLHLIDQAADEVHHGVTCHFDTP